MDAAARLDEELHHWSRYAKGDVERLWGWGTPAGRQRAKRRGELIARAARLGPGVRALEVGCGTGVFTDMFAATGASLVAVDLTEGLLEKARARVPASVRLLCKPFEDCSDEGPFDAVIGSSVLHHLDFGDALREILRLLEPGGVLSFAEPNLLNPQVFVERRFRRFFPRITPSETAFVHRQVQDELERAGFVDVAVTPFDFLHPSTPPALIDGVSRLGRLLERIPLARSIAGSLHISARKP